MTEPIPKPITLTVDGYLEASCPKHLLEHALLCAYRKISDIRDLAEYHTDKLVEGYCFEDIYFSDPDILKDLRMTLTLGDEKTLKLQIYPVNKD
ncbi:hypothetical protein [Moraxella nonliquefaciens]|jgi:hypothetical protein|uniref:hypothetical protein n=1 Tax=Moraxella nonliquefaciens TaxID=478 RepID=UPI001EF61F47|nr:hypothetical protein [Moraxella nonliquefaciens]MCG7412712.1 hypothetical protein [Moraxella nonliquefaciens]